MICGRWVWRTYQVTFDDFASETPGSQDEQALARFARRGRDGSTGKRAGNGRKWRTHPSDTNPSGQRGDR